MEIFGKPTLLINQSMNDEAVYRTAPGTPGLLKNYRPQFPSQYESSHMGTTRIPLGLETTNIILQYFTRDTDRGVRIAKIAIIHL